jgi:hypothetical protein
MRPPRIRESCPLPGPTTQLSRALIRHHSMLRGELVKAKSRQTVLVERNKARQAMRHIEAVLSYLGTDFDPNALKPTRIVPKTGPLEYGDLRSGILGALRRRDDWMTYQEITQWIVTAKRLELSNKQYKHFLQKLREATHVLAKEGAVIPAGQISQSDGTKIQRWRLSPVMFPAR